ncbi:MAG: DNA cytosine methyltransferase [Novosphingobium sp.]|nr:DNA cytosine methyltransferase [Novosphingobium sp.]
MRYLSVCAGIEAATVAWHPLGWEPAAFSEIEAFPRAVLAHQFPNVPLHGDFTTIGADDYGPIDLLVGGTPCQSFSIAGLRGGLADDRGNLALEFLCLADRKRPRWIVWENVPGVLSATSHVAPDICAPDIDLDAGNGPEDGEEIVVTDCYEADEDHAFACFMAGLQELGYGAAYRILDAQYAGVPQRRRRVFVAGYLGDWRRAAAVLFERHSLSGHPAPRQEAGKVSPTIPSRSLGGGGLGTDFDCDGGLIQQSWPAEIAPTLNAHFGDKMGLENQHINSGCGHFVSHALRGEGFDASEDGTGRGTPIVPGAFHCKGTEVQFTTDGVNPPLRSMSHNTSHQNAGGHAAVAYDLRGQSVRRLTPTECERLQGFPDDWTLIPYRGKPADQCPDGPRYKALGNSMAVPVMRWIGERIALVESIHMTEAA